jgi:polyisoprenoid-binding protein YceI
MNKLINTLMMFSMILLVGSMTSCKDSEGAKAEISNKGAVAVATGVTMEVDLDNSKVMWEGTKPTGSHNGTVNVGGGSVSVKDGKVTGGNFTLDMNSITCLDLEGDSKAGLEGHLKGTAEAEKVDHFFNVKKYPTAKFEITKVTDLAGNPDANSLVYGNLTMKDQTKQVSFKANIATDGKMVKVSAPKFTIDRTQWKVTYGSKSIFDNLKDKFINDEIGLQIELAAKG